MSKLSPDTLRALCGKEGVVDRFEKNRTSVKNKLLSLTLATLLAVIATLKKNEESNENQSNSTTQFLENIDLTLDPNGLPNPDQLTHIARRIHPNLTENVVNLRTDLTNRTCEIEFDSGFKIMYSDQHIYLVQHHSDGSNQVLAVLSINPD